MSNFYELKRKQGVLQAYSLPDLMAGIQFCIDNDIKLGDPNRAAKVGNMLQIELAEKEEVSEGENFLTRKALEKHLAELNSKNKVEQFARKAYMLDVERSLSLEEMKESVAEHVFPSPRKPFSEMVTAGEKVDWFREEEKEEFDAWAFEECGIKLDGRKNFENMKKQFWEEYTKLITEEEENTSEDTQEDSEDTSEDPSTEGSEETKE